jgi:hypothetical protein
MKNRLAKYFLHLFIKYVPSANKIADDEAKRLAAYVFDNFTERERLLISIKMKDFLVELTETQISEKEVVLNDQIKELENLKKILSKLQKDEKN